ncbi:MAG TPA: hypothetical protein ENI46_02365, partial [Firmicutes bacterium]|nr:hypothetical protein [Bacillota bacterium]
MDRGRLIWAIVRKEYNELAGRWTSFLFPATLVLLFTLNTTMMARMMISKGNVAAFRLLSEVVLTNYSIAMFMLCAVPMIPSLFAKESLTGTIEWLLASPLEPRMIWLGKAAFLFLWSFGFASIYVVVSSTIVYWLAHNVGTGMTLKLPSLAFILVNPLTCASFALLLSEISMISRTKIVAFWAGVAVVGFIAASSSNLRFAGAPSRGPIALGMMAIICGLLTLVLA